MAACVKTGCPGDVAVNEMACPTCGSFSGFPNVKCAAAEGPDLEARVQAAREANPTAAAQIATFADAMAASHAVVNVSFAFLHSLLASNIPLYSTYDEQVRSGIRRPAAPEHDQERAAIGGLLFGYLSSRIVYAALTLDGRGLASYGPVAVQLSDSSVEARASVLEENSYRFVARHKITSPALAPRGYRAPWASRSAIAVAKLAGRITTATMTSQYQDLLLSSTQDRATDDFIEVHIVDGFDRLAIEQVVVMQTPETDLEHALLAAARERAQELGIVWVQP